MNSSKITINIDVKAPVLKNDSFQFALLLRFVSSAPQTRLKSESQAPSSFVKSWPFYWHFLWLRSCFMNYSPGVELDFQDNWKLFTSITVQRIFSAFCLRRLQCFCFIKQAFVAERFAVQWFELIRFKMYEQKKSDKWLDSRTASTSQPENLVTAVTQQCSAVDFDLGCDLIRFSLSRCIKAVPWMTLRRHFRTKLVYSTQITIIMAALASFLSAATSQHSIVHLLRRVPSFSRELSLSFPRLTCCALKLRVINLRGNWQATVLFVLLGFPQFFFRCHLRHTVQTCVVLMRESSRIHCANKFLWICLSADEKSFASFSRAEWELTMEKNCGDL